MSLPFWPSFQVEKTLLGEGLDAVAAEAGHREHRDLVGRALARAPRECASIRSRAAGLRMPASSTTRPARYGTSAELAVGRRGEGGGEQGGRQQRGDEPRA